MWQKKWIDKVTKLGMLYEAPLESKKFNTIKCPRIDLNYNLSNISEKLIKFCNQISSDYKLEAFQIFYEI